MAKYLIHACPQRLWYVEEHLIPSMVAQGIDRGDISIFTDTEKLGNLEAFMQSLLLIEEGSGVWHMQDDVVISKQFRRWTEEYDDGVVCGFCSKYSRMMPAGLVDVKYMWYSFPCIRIPNVIAQEFSTWFYRECMYNPAYTTYIQKKKYDDSIFHDYMESHCPEMEVLNLAPNIVEHIDYLIGGSTINPGHNEEPIKSLYWDEQDTIIALRRELDV